MCACITISQQRRHQKGKQISIPLTYAEIIFSLYLLVVVAKGKQPMRSARAVFNSLPILLSCIKHQNSNIHVNLIDLCHLCY